MERHIPEATPARLLGFGVIVFTGFALLGAWLHLWWLAAVGTLVLVLSPLRPVSRPLYLGWMHLGLLMSRITSPVVLLVIYLVVITPVAFLSRLFRRDPLRLRRPAPGGTFWEDRPRARDAASYLRQY